VAGPEALFVQNANQAFDSAGRLVDERVKELLARYMVGFAVFVELNKRPQST
jgi:hypothetical protein